MLCEIDNKEQWFQMIKDGYKINHYYNDVLEVVEANLN
jgi:hypothetical protein